jgi:hypothetical protein
MGSTISGNTSGSAGNFGSGGGIYHGYGSGSLTISYCTISGNTAGLPVTGHSGFGGGLDLREGTTSISNSTISGNMVNGTSGFYGGGGIGFAHGAILTITNSTITGNVDNTFGGGGISSVGSKPFTLRNSIVAGNTTANPAQGPDIFDSGTINVDFSLIGNGTGIGTITGANNLVGTSGSPINPLLGPLQNNGGLTFTHALLPGSPAINRGDPAFTPPPGFDQRGAGFNRVINNRLDMGAYEFQPPDTMTTVVSSLNPSVQGQEVTFTATVTATTPGSNTPVGTVTFLDNGSPLAAVTLVNGMAAFSTTTLTFGTHTITAQYNGFTQGNYTLNPSSAQLIQVVNAQVTGFIATGTDRGGGPEVKVFDAKTGALKFDFLAYDSTFLGGVRVAVGDVNGDGVADIITVPGPGGGPLVQVFSGTNLTLLVAFNAYDPAFLGGLFVATGDVNHDGFADIVTAPDLGGGPLVHVFDGKTGTALLSFNAYDPAFLGGVRVAAGDTNGDGFADIITGPGFGGGPLVRVFDGRSGAALLSFNAYAGSFTGGIYVTAGDINGDGRADIITSPGVGGGPLVNVFSGPTGALLKSFNAYPPVASPLSIFGSDGIWQSGVRVAAVDVSGDGKADIITGVGPSQRPEVKVFDAVTLALLDDFFAYDPAYLGGVFVAAGR